MENMFISKNRMTKMDDIPVHLNEIMKDIHQGREILLTHHDRIIAKIIPFSDRGKPEKWPDFSQRAVAIFGKSPKISASDSLAETREERF